MGTIAIDGTKMGTDAALDANRGRAAISAELERLRAEVGAVLSEARALDATEEAQRGLFGLDRLPTELATRRGRAAHLEAALASIEAADAADAEVAAARASQAREAAAEGRKLNGRKPKGPRARLARAEADVEAVQAKVEAAQAARAAERAAKEAQAAAAGRRLRGLRPTGGARPSEQQLLEQAHEELAEAGAAAADAVVEERQTNVTDPESRMMKTTSGWVQGYNAQAAVNEHQVVVACKVTQDANDVGQYEPMVSAALAALAAAGVVEPIGTVLADAGYWSEGNATGKGPDRLIATLKDWKQRRAARELGTTSGPPPENASALEAMEHRLRTPRGPRPTPGAPTPWSRSSPTSRRTVASAAFVAGASAPPVASGR